MADAEAGFGEAELDEDDVGGVMDEGAFPNENPSWGSGPAGTSRCVTTYRCE